MSKVIITVYGRASEGKSETVKNVCQQILQLWPNAKHVTHDNKPIDFSQDVLLSIDVGKVKIGIESQGDPNSRMIWADSILQLADQAVNPALGNCDIIVCTSRTEGMTVLKVDQIAQKYSYKTIWKSSYYTPDLPHSTVNHICAQEIVNLIVSVIAGVL